MSKEAEARFQEGLELAKGGKYEEARAKFLQSLAVSKSSKTLLNLTIAEKNSGHPSDALRHLRAYFREPGANAQKVADLKKELFPQLYSQSAHLKIEAPLGSAVSVDGEPADHLDEEYDVAPGPHVIAALLNGKRETRSIVGEKGATQTVSLAPTEVTTPPRIAPPAPLTPNPPPPTTEPSSSFWTTRRWVGVGVAGIGLVGGVVGFAVARGSASSAEDDRASLAKTLPGGCSAPSADCTRLGTLTDDRVSANNVATVSLIAGGALVAVGAVLVLLPESKGQKTTLSVAPSLSGASVFGTF